MKFNAHFSLFLILGLFLSACASTVTQQPTAEMTIVATTETPLVEQTTSEQPPRPGAAGRLVLATTTSTDDSGLLVYLLPDFEKKYGVKVDVIAVGTGQALQIGMDGNADVLLVHARDKEDEFMAAQHGIRREDVMYNDFVLVGPADDPANVKGMKSAVEAFKRIAEAQATFISRGDESGTHTKEKSIWVKAGIEPAGEWYISAGQGMGEILTMTDEQRAYTLSDRATYLARLAQGLSLEILVEGDPALFNPYGVIIVNPHKNPAINVELATKFVEWLISIPVQEKIQAFGVEEFGQSLFIPDSQLWRNAQRVTPRP
jgi:tungstate transport system substrate-binding protein